MPPRFAARWRELKPRLNALRNGDDGRPGSHDLAAAMVFMQALPKS
jgi:hypothetical protein